MINILINTIGKYFIINFLILILVYVTGRLIRKILLGKNRMDLCDLFFDCIIGLFFIVFIYAIIITHCKSILLGLLIISLYYFLNKKEINNKIGSKPVAPLSVGNVFFIGFTGLLLITVFCFITTIDKDGIRLPHVDFLWYSSIANSLSYGHENQWQALNFFHDNLGASPYHYFELWASLLFSKLSGQTTLMSLIYITNPVFSAIFFLGIAALLEFYSFKKTIPIIIISFILLFSGPSVFEFLNNTLGVNMIGFINQTSVMNNFGMKFSPLYLCLVSAVILIIVKKDWSFGILVLCITPLLNISMIAVPFAAIIFVLASGRFGLQVMSKYQLIIYLISILFFIGLFYVVNGSGKATDTNPAEFANNFKSKAAIFKFLKLSIGYHGWLLFYLAISYGLILFLIIIKRRKVFSEKYISPLFLLMFCCIVSGFIFSFLSYTIPNHAQFFTNNLVFLNIMIIISIVRLIDRITFLNFYSLGFYGIVLMVSVDNIWMIYKRRFIHSTNLTTYFSPIFLEKSKELLQKNSCPIIPVIANNSLFNIENPNGNFVMSKYMFLFTNSLQIFINNYSEKSFFASEPFVIFIKNIKLPLAQSYTAYFKNNNFRICITAEKAPWYPPMKMVEYSIKDSISRETLYLLRQNISKNY